MAQLNFDRGKDLHASQLISKSDFDQLRVNLSQAKSLVKTRQVAAHLKCENWCGQCKRDPEPSCHIRKFWIGNVVGRHLLRFERHTANRARPRPYLPNLRMHRAGVDRVLRDWRGSLRFRR